MRMNRRAEGSFAETMVAMMVVTIALSAFMSVFAYSLHTADDGDQYISTDFTDGISISDGEFSGIDEDYVSEECARRGYASMVIVLETAGGVDHVYLKLGTSSDTDFTFTKGSFIAPCDDGSQVIVNYEVVAFV